MKIRTAMVTVFAAVVGVAASPLALAQKGIGSEIGIARQAQLPEVVSLRGKVMEVNSHPCENTTGRAPVGTHILVRNKVGEELNIHLGPAAQVKHVADKLKPGRKIGIDGFRTDQMPENHYVAKALRIGDEVTALRDDYLRPVWRFSSGNRWGGRCRGYARNSGGRAGRGRGFCWQPGW